jgi:molybdate transport system regulatory protein
MSSPTMHFAQALGHDASDKRLDILRRIGTVGSISEAARGAGVSYKAAWQALENLSNLAGAPLIDKSVGGSGGGGARLTQAGQQLLDAAERLNAARRTVLAELENNLDNTLSMQGLAGLGLRTSMRNQLPCKVHSIAQSAGSARVQLELPNGAMLTAKITCESVELLGLQKGMAALALCKATAVSISTAVPVRSDLNVLDGEISRLSPDGQGGDVAVQLMPGLQLTGFPAQGMAFALHQGVKVSLDASAVVIAIAG